MNKKDTPNRTVFINGEFVPEKEALIPVTTHGLHYGTGVFEGIRAYYNEEEKALFIFRAKDHFARMKQSAKIMFLDIPFSVDELVELAAELLKKNFQDFDLYIRPLAFKSDAAVGNFNLTTLETSFLMYTVGMGRYLDSEKGIRVCVSSWKKNSDNALPSRGKITGGYASASLAKTEAVQNGFDDALQMDERGHIVEGSTANLFMVKNNVVYTPPTSDDILVGITRDTVIKLCQEQLRVKVIEKSLDRSEVYSGDEVFEAGTAVEITPIVEIDHRTIGSGMIGPVEKQLKELFRRLVHGDLPEYKHFLTKVTK